MIEPIQPGTRYTKDGVSVDVDAVIAGEVYVRRWPKGVESQPMFANCIRIPIQEFSKQIEGLSPQTTNEEER